VTPRPGGVTTRSRRDLLIAFSGIMLTTLLTALDQTSGSPSSAQC
jgi:hypothetical protein